jgi:hypothetical protein
MHYKCGYRLFSSTKIYYIFQTYKVLGCTRKKLDPGDFQIKNISIQDVLVSSTVEMILFL